MGIQNKDGALYFATGIDNTGFYTGKREAIGIIKAMASEITSFDVFGGLGISAGMAFAKAAKDVYNFEKQFQQSMKEVATLSSGIKGSLADFMNQVVDITTKVPVAANEAAKALYQIVSAGHDGADGMKILEVSAKAAIGGVTDTATAADAITTLINAYKLSATDAENISNQLFTTVKLGKTSFGQLGQSIAQAAPIAAAYGVEIDQVLAAVATLTKQGTPTAQAMTQIRAAIVGVSKYLGDGAYNGRTFQDALELVRQKAGGSEAKLREMIPEIEAVNGLLGLTGNNAQEASDHLAEVGNSAGAAEEAFKEMVTSGENQMKLLSNNITSVLRPLGQGILEKISSAAQSINDSFADGSAQESLKNIRDLIIDVTVALAGYKGSILAISVAKQIHSTIDGIILKQKAIEAIQLEVNSGLYFEEAASIAMNTSSRTLLTKAIKAQTTAQLKNAAAMLTNPYVLAAIVVAGLGYAVYKLATAESAAEKATRKHREEQERFRKTIDERKQKIEELIRIIQDETETEYAKVKAYEELQRYSPALVAAYTREQLAVASLTDTSKKLNEEREKQNYDNVIGNVKKYTEIISKAHAEAERLRKEAKKSDDPEKISVLNNAALGQELSISNAERELKQWQKDLDEINRLRKKAAEDNKPVEVKILEAKNNREQILQEFLAAKITLEEEQRKIKEAGFGIIPIDVQIRFNGAQDALNNVDGIINNLNNQQGKGQQEKTGQTYQQAYKQAQADWKAKIKALNDAKSGAREDYIKAQEDLDKAESVFKSLGGDTTGKLKKDADELRKDQEKLNQLQKKQSKDNIRQLKDLEFEAAQSRIDAMQEGSEKTISQMQLDNKKEIEALKRTSEDYLQKKIEAERTLFEADPSNKGKSFNSSTVSLDKKEEDLFKNLLESTISKQGNELSSYYKELLSKYQSYTDKRLAAQKKFQAERDALVKAGASKETLAEQDYQRDETFKSIDNEFAMREDSFKVWADNVADLSLEKLRVLLVEAERELERYEFLNLNDPRLAVQRAKVVSLKNTVSEKSEKTNTSPEKRSQKEWQDLYSILSKVEKEFEDIGNTVGGTAGEIISSAGGIASSTLKMIDGIVTLSDSSAWAITSTATTAEKAIKSVEKASVILAIIGAALQVASKISEMITGENQEERMKKTVDYYNKIVDIYDQIIDKQKESIKFGYGFSSIEAAGKAMDDLNKKTEYNRKIANISGKSGVLAKDISSYAKDYEKIAKEFGISFNAILLGFKAGIDTSELSQLSGKQLEFIRDNYKELWAGLRDEQRDALQAIIDAETEGKAIIDKWQEAITGISYDSFYTEFIDTLSDMDSSAEDMAKNFGDYLKKSILAAMVAKNFQKDIDSLYDMWAAAGDVNSAGGNEITKDEATAIQEEYKRIVEAMAKMRDDMADTYNWESTLDSMNSFVSDIESSLTSLESTAKDVSDNIYDYFRQSMIRALYEKEYKSKMEELFKEFQKLSADGLSEGDMTQLNSQIDQYINQMMKGVEGVNSLFSDKLKDAEDLQSFVDNVKSAMSNIEATAEDVTDNIFEYIRQQMVDKMFTDTFQPQIEEFYKKVQAAMSDGSVTDEERNALKDEADKLAKDIIAAKDILSETLGISADNIKKAADEEFKSFSDSILSSLSDAEVTAKTISKNIAESMRKELIEAMYLEQYEPRIRAIWDKWKEYSSDGLVTDEERASIKNDIDEISKEVADAAKEIGDAWTDTGEDVEKAFESFSDSIKNVLYNAEATAEDVANNIYQYMRNALVDSMFSAQLQPQIKAWYDKYTEFMKDGAIDSTERMTLDEMLAEIQKAGVDIVDAANKLFPTLDTGAQNMKNEAEQEWESFSDNILSSLYDLEASAEDISDDMGEYMRKALIKAMYVENYKPQMQKWYEAWKNAMSDENLTSEEKQMLDSMKSGILDGMKKEMDSINQMFGSMYSQEASSKGFEGMSQDTGEELNGRFTTFVISNEEIKNQMVVQTGLNSDQLRILTEIYFMTYEHFSESSGIMNDVLAYLEGIKKDTAHLYFIRESLKNIEKNSDRW